MKRRFSLGSVLSAAVLGMLLCAALSNVQWVHASAGRMYVAITLDDGYASTYDLAYPYLHGLGIPATVAVPCNVVNSTYEGVATMTWEEINILSDSGWCIASHGTGIGFSFIAASFADMYREMNGTYADFNGNMSSIPTVYVITAALINSTGEMYLSNYYQNAWGDWGTSTYFNVVMNLTDSTSCSWYRYNSPRMYGQTEGSVGNPTANESNVIGNYTAAIDCLVNNYTANPDCDYALALTFHNLATAPRGDPYNDYTPTVFTTVVQYAVGKGVTFTTLGQLDRAIVSGAGGSYSGSVSGVGGSTTAAINGWLPIIIEFAMLALVLGMLKRVKF